MQKFVAHILSVRW